MYKNIIIQNLYIHKNIFFQIFVFVYRKLQVPSTMNISPFTRESPMSKMVTLVHPFNPFNKVAWRETLEDISRYWQCVVCKNTKWSIKMITSGLRMCCKAGLEITAHPMATNVNASLFGRKNCNNYELPNGYGNKFAVKIYWKLCFPICLSASGKPIVFLFLALRIKGKF